MKNYAVILAAGKGTRMKSDMPKVLHKVCGIPMLQHIINELKAMNIEDIIVVIGHKSEQIRKAIKDDVIFVEQTEQSGTAHAVSQAIPYLQGKGGTTLVITGDTPLIEAKTLNNLLTQHHFTEAHGTVLTAIQPDPTGYGRIVRNRKPASNSSDYGTIGSVLYIVEEKDAHDIEKDIHEVNTGIFAFNNASLMKVLPTIKNQNNQQEYYLTDIVSEFVKQGLGFEGITLNEPSEAFGINSRVQLAEAERMMRTRINNHHMNNGVTIIDPMNTYIEKQVIIGKDTIIYPGVVLEGKTVIGEGSLIHSSSEIKDSQIGKNTTIRQSVIHNSEIGDNVQVGPFAHIRPETVIGNQARIGNFVEVKKSTIGKDSKVSHLSYIGDASIGQGVNVGCGSITVNYDGQNKFQTTIEDNAFIGCNTNLIAPVTVGKNSLIAAGSTITDDIPKDSLAIARARQTNKLEYNKK